MWIIRQSFLVKYRLLLNVPLEDIHTQNAADIDWPIYKTVEDFEEKAGSKMKALVRLLLHINSHDQAPPPYVDPENNDRMKFPEIPVVPEGETAPQSDKTLVHFSFSAITPTLVSVRIHFPTS